MTANVEESIRRSISKSGFPKKVVRLPFKPVYDACKNQGTSLTEVLERLRKENIMGTIQGNQIEFRSPDHNKDAAEEKSGGKSGGLPWMKGIPDLGNLKDTAMEYLSRLSPEQMSQIRQMVDNMSEEEKKNILKSFSKKTDPEP